MAQSLEKLLSAHFGDEWARLQPKIKAEYDALLPLAGGETKGRKKNLVEGIYPFAAIYRVLRAEGEPQDAAMQEMFAIMEQRTRTGMRKTYETMGKLPFFFAMFRKMFSTGLKGDSWKVEWIANDKNSFIYNIQTCLWHDACTQLGCPELCQIFCRNDEINFTDVSKHLYFTRSQTLGEGGSCCDFHFYPHAPVK